MRISFFLFLFVFPAFFFPSGGAHAGQAVLSWAAPSANTDGTQLTDLAGYWVYYGTEEGNYSQNIKLAGSETNYTVSNLSKGTYYFAVTAYDTYGNQSAFSNEVNKTILSFDDEIDNVFAPYIEAIETACITYGCGNNNYCPSLNVTRAQMAAFIIRAMFADNFNYTKTPYYTDEPPADYFFKYIQKMRDLHITVVADNYNPDGYVTRSQMAAFLVRAARSEAGQDTENFAYTQTPYFDDVPPTDVFFKYVQKLKDMGITTVTGTYNASQNVTREEMAALISRAFLGMQ